MKSKSFKKIEINNALKKIKKAHKTRNINVNFKKLITKITNPSELLIFKKLKRTSLICNYSYVVKRKPIKLMKKGIIKTIIFNNTKKQLFISILSGSRLIRSISTGYVLKNVKNLKKNFKNKVNAYVLSFKFLTEIIENIFKKNIFIVQIKGCKIYFPKLIRFINTKSLKSRFKLFVFTPSIKYNSLNVKKVSSIKRKMKKKYIYNSPFM